MNRFHSLAPVILCLGLLAACGGEAPSPGDDESSSGPPATSSGDVPTGGGGTKMAPGSVATIHLFSLYRMQGQAEGIPCLAGGIQPLAAAAETKRLALEAGEASYLIAVGDMLLPTGIGDVHPARNLSSRTRASVVLEAMAVAGVDLYVPGQADLAHDPDWLLNKCAKLNIPVLMTNVSVVGHDETLLTKVIENNGFRLGCLGITRAHTIREADRDLVNAKKARVTANVTSKRLESNDMADFVIVFSNVAQSPSLAMTKLPSVHAVLGTLGPDEGAEKGAMLRDGALYMMVEPMGREIGHTTIRIVDGDLVNVVNMSPVHELPRKVEAHQQELESYVERFGTDDLVTLAQLVTPDNPDYFLRKAMQINENREYVAELLDHTGSAFDHRPAAAVEIPDDSPVLAKLATLPDRFVRAYEEVDFGPLRTPDPEMEIPHPDSCLDCHQAQYDFWKTTDHAGAYETLKGIGMDYDVLCLGCHTSGFDTKGGYRDPREEAPFGPVGCFDCHGTTFPHFGMPGAVVDTLFTSSEADYMECYSCHTKERSPNFDRDTQTERVRCPPMGGDEPALVKAWHVALGTIERREESGNLLERDAHRKVRALVGLGRIEEAIVEVGAIMETNRRDVRLAIELARRLDEVGRSDVAIDTIRTFVRSNPGHPLANEEYVRLLLEASDPSLRDPQAALRELRFILPPKDSSEGEDTDGENVSFRVLRVDALMATGQQQAGAQELMELGARHAQDTRVLRRLKRYFGGVPEAFKR